MNMLMSAATVLVLTGTATFVASCSDDDDTENDPALGQIAALSETASFAFTEDGPDGIYDYLATSVTEVCGKEEFREALARGLIPTGWRKTSDIVVTADTATASVVLITEGGDVTQDWTFALEDESWRIESIPGLEECP